MRGNIKHSQLRIFVQRVIAYGVQEVSLAHAGLTIDKQGIENSLAGTFGYGYTSCTR